MPIFPAASRASIRQRNICPGPRAVVGMDAVHTPPVPGTMPTTESVPNMVRWNSVTFVMAWTVRDTRAVMVSGGLPAPPGGRATLESISTPGASATVPLLLVFPGVLGEK